MADEKTKKRASNGKTPRLVVGVGASAGGLEAFSTLLKAVADVRGMTFLLVQHLDPTHESLLADILKSKSGLAVVEAGHGVQLAEDTIYVIRPGTAMAVEDNRIVLSVPQLIHGIRLPVDHLFKSLAREYGTQAVGIVLSGAGSDGSAGVREIHNGGGFTIAQDLRSCSQAGMPQSAIGTGAIDLVLDSEAMPAALERFARIPPETRAAPPPAEDTDVDEETLPASAVSKDGLSRLAALLEAHSRFDMRVYKEATVSRRVRRRMLLGGIDDFNDYLNQLQASDKERYALQRDLMISVTDFFRDEDAFAELRMRVIAPIVESKQSGETIRVWVPGCATGEEAYSIGMEFLDAINAQSKHLSLQIFATDIDTEALAFARSGIYASSVAGNISPDRMRTYFESFDQRGYHVRPLLRDRISFAVHDLAKDPPFFRMDLICCRNLLIYLRPEAQEDVINGLHFALSPDGYLFLGPSEALGRQAELFSAESKKWRIYQKVGDSRQMPRRQRRRYEGRVRQTSRPITHAAEKTALRSDSTTSIVGDDALRRGVIAALVPPTLVLSAEGDILFMHGELRPYLRFPEGNEPRLNIASIVSPELATRTRGAIYTCRKERRTVVTLSGIGSEENQQIRITANPCSEIGDGAVVLSFETVSAKDSAAPGDAPTSHSELASHLESELVATQEDLRTTAEELDTASEQLRSSGEEATSMNEELQSANEELEATTEELRSLNEELTTVNAQLRERIEQVGQSHDDLSNFMSSTKIATLFLDERLNIKRFTPAAEALLTLDSNSVGQFIGDIARDALQNELQDESLAVLDDFSSRVREIRLDDGRCLTREVLPYRTRDRHIKGVVVTFVDISDLKEASNLLSIRQRQSSEVAQLGLHALQNPDLQNFMDETVRVVQKVLNADFTKILELQPGGKRLFLRSGIGWEEGIVGEATVSTGLESQAGFTLRASDAIVVDNLQKEKRFNAPAILAKHSVISGISCPIRYGDGVYGVIGAHTRDERSFLPEDADFVQSVASIIGYAVSQEQTRVRLAAEADVAAILAKVQPLDAMFSKVLDAILKIVDGGVGEVWWPDAGKKLLDCRYLQVSGSFNRSVVREQFSSRTFTPGEGLIGTVFSSATANWLTEFADPAMFVRNQIAGKLGLKSAIAFPLVAGTEILGVVAVYAQRRFFANQSLLRSFETLGRFIGDYIDRKDIESQVHHLAAITRSSHDAILSYDFRGVIREWLGGAESLYGYTAKEMVGQPLDVLVPESRRDELYAVIKRIKSGEVIDPLDTPRLNKDGSIFEVSSRCSPILNANGDIIAMSSTDRDITAQKRAERDLRDADQQKDQFLAMLGHELRNPLAALHSAAALLQVSEGDSRTVKRTQEIIERQTHHMSKLLDGLLDISRIVQGQIVLDRKIIDLSEICLQVLMDVENRAQKRELRLSKMIPAAPVWVNGDPVRLTQIFENLVSNAINYSENGGSIAVELRTKSGYAELRVVDTGIGIDADFMPHIFEVFRQGTRSLDRSQGGLGIGLALVKSLVERHHGTVEVSSGGVGKGADFTIWLPLSDGKPEEVSETLSEPPVALAILLIEDNEDSAEMQKQVLTLLGHKVWIAPTGKEGIQLARLKAPDLIFCDLGLPQGMSGYDVATYLRADAELSHIPLIALSGYGSPEDKRKAAETGFDEHLTKPVGIQAMQRVIGGVAKQRARV